MRGDLSDAALHPSRGTRGGSRRGGRGLAAAAAAAAAAATHACGGRGGRVAAAAQIRGHVGVDTARGDLSDAALHPSRGTREGSRRARLPASSTHACSCYAKLALAEGRCEYVVRGKEEGEGRGRKYRTQGKFTYTSSVRRRRLYAGRSDTCRGLGHRHVQRQRHANNRSRICSVPAAAPLILYEGKMWKERQLQEVGTHRQRPHAYILETRSRVDGDDMGGGGPGTSAPLNMVSVNLSLVTT